MLCKASDRRMPLSLGLPRRCLATRVATMRELPALISVRSLPVSQPFGHSTADRTKCLTLRMLFLISATVQQIVFILFRIYDHLASGSSVMCHSCLTGGSSFMCHTQYIEQSKQSCVRARAHTHAHGLSQWDSLRR